MTRYTRETKRDREINIIMELKDKNYYSSEKNTIFYRTRAFGGSFQMF